LESSESKQLISSAKSNYSAQISRVLAVSLFASLLTLAPLVTPSADANGLGPSTYLDGVCNIEDSDPANHLTPETAFVIDTVDKLWEVTDCSSASATVYFRIDRDLDASDANFAPTASPIGYSTSGVSSFSGVLDGGGFEISVSMTTNASVGLFALIHTATISNLAINGSFTTTTGLTGADGAAGGLAARLDGDVNIISVANSANVSGKRHVGGLVGYASGPITIASSRNSGEIEGTGDHVGGLLGWGNLAATINQSVNTGPVETVGNAGGLAGWVQAVANIQNCQNTGQVSGRFFSGGLLGYSVGGALFANSTNSGNVLASAGNYVGGITGIVTGNLTASNVVNLGEVTAEDYIGGIAGYVSGNSVIEDSSNFGEIDGTQAVGGIIGYPNGPLQATRVMNSATVSGTGDTGGLVGVAFKAANFDQVNSNANVTGGSNTGGLIGYAYRSIGITNSYTLGTVTGGTNQGPWIGVLNNDTSVTLNNSYTTMTGSRDNGVYGVRYANNQAAYTGGIFGSGSFTSSQISLAADDAKAATFYPGWDFDSVWGFGACNENGGLPSLRFLGTFSVYYELGCDTPTPQSAEPEVEAPAPTYQGPIITPIKAEVSIGSELVITGSRLESVNRVLIGATEQELVNASSTKIIIKVSPSSSDGVQDLILYSAFGSLTYQGAVNVISVTTEEAIVSSKSVVLIAKTKLLSKDSTVAEAWLQGNLVGSGLSKVICTVTVASDATTHQRVQARKLAKESCSRAAAYLPGASVWFQTKATIHSRLTGRTFITFRG
jgi:hypothetical protein